MKDNYFLKSVLVVAKSAAKHFLYHSDSWNEYIVRL